MVNYQDLEVGCLYEAVPLRSSFNVALYIGEGRFLYAGLDTLMGNVMISSAYEESFDSSSSIVRPVRKIEEPPKWTRWDDEEIDQTYNRSLIYYLAYWQGRVHQLKEIVANTT